ncbi:MAG: uracil-DNA glycosylase [Burkholderiaceae bacterium]
MNRAKAWAALDIGPQWIPRRRAGSGDSRAPAAQIAAARGETDATATEERPDAVLLGRTPDTEEQAQPAAAGSGDWQVIAADWDLLRAEALGCSRCALSQSRRQVVFGVGDRRPDWVVVGEAPGAEEDRRGEPFVGEAGQLLDAMLEAVGMSRARGVFILNVLKCRPPGNRDPAPEEVRECNRFLQAQLTLLAPRLVLAMGRFAAHTLLGTDEKIGQLRQREHRIDIDGRPVPLVVSYHPAYLLRSPVQKRLGWQDLCRARALVPLSAPGDQKAR